MILIKASNKDTKNSVIYELMKIENQVYKEEFRGKYNSIYKRFLKFPEMFYIAFDNKRIVGYLCYFPISDSLYRDIVENGIFCDDDIEPKDVVPFSSKTHLYFLSIAIYKEYQDRGIADRMMEEFEKRINLEKEKGNYVKDITAATVTEDGEKFALKYGYKLLYDKLDENGYKIYRKDIYEENE